MIWSAAQPLFRAHIRMVPIFLSLPHLEMQLHFCFWN